MIIDLHAHTREHSPCSHQTAEELIRRAGEVGLDGIVLTDHDHLWDRDALQVVLERLRVPIVVLRGQEVSCKDGHLLVYGIEETVPGDERRAEVVRRVRGENGAAVLPHPFRWEGFKGLSDEQVLQELTAFDALEALTTNHSKEEQARAMGFQGMEGVQLVGGSDAHALDRVGLYATRFETRFRTERELAALLRAGSYCPVRRNPLGAYVDCC